MYRIPALMVRHVTGNIVLAATTFCLAAIAHSQTTAAGESTPVGRLDFEAAKLPEANVEVDLSQEMFKDLFGIGDAAIAGVAEALMKSSSSDESTKGTRLAAEQLETARQILQLAGNVVHEVRVRVYESLPEETAGPQKLFNAFDEQLSAGKWETLARVHNKKEMVRVSAIRGGGAVQGIFVVATDGNSVVVANIVCDVSPENVKKLTSAATKVGLENGLAQAIELKMRHLPGAAGSRPTIVIKNDERLSIPSPPAPPTRPAEPTER